MGLSALQDQAVIHRDLKSENILLNLDGDIKIGDFGFMASWTDETQFRSTKIGSICWMSPEMVQN